MVDLSLFRSCMKFKKIYDWLDKKVIATILITKILILFFAVQSYQIATNQPITESYKYLGIWKNWDAIHYLDIAQLGYSNFGDNKFLIVFFPLFPALIALFNLLIDDYLVSGFVVAGIASVFVGLLFNHLVRLDFSKQTAHYSVFFLFIFPTSYFLHIPYTESVFLALCLGCFLAARKGFWITVGVLGFFACMTRINGLILFPALLFEIWNEYTLTGKLNRRWISLGFIPVGFLLYLCLNYYISGNPTVFLTYQKEHWSKYLRFPIYGLWETYKSLFVVEPAVSLMRGFQELLFVIIGLAAIVLGWKYLRNSYKVWMILNWLLFVSTSYILSVPRYTLILFPLFILISLAAEKSEIFKQIFTVWSILYLSLFIIQFVRVWWAF